MNKIVIILFTIIGLFVAFGALQSISELNTTDYNPSYPVIEREYLLLQKISTINYFSSKKHLLEIKDNIELESYSTLKWVHIVVSPNLELIDNKIDEKYIKSGTIEQVENNLSEPIKIDVITSGNYFDTDWASEQLDRVAINAKSCLKNGESVQAVPVAVTFSPSGIVTTSIVSSGPFMGTVIGGCVAKVFRQIKLSPFDGKPTTVHKNVRIQ